MVRAWFDPLTLIRAVDLLRRNRDDARLVFLGMKHPNPEVADAFWVPLAALRETTQWGKAFVPIRGVGEREVDAFQHGGYTVWGLTHRALMQFLQLLS